MYRFVGAASPQFLFAFPAVAARRRVTPRPIATGVPRARPVGGATAGSTQSPKEIAHSGSGARRQRPTTKTRSASPRLIRSVRHRAKSVATEIGTSKSARKHGRFRTSSASVAARGDVSEWRTRSPRRSRQPQQSRDPPAASIDSRSLLMDGGVRGRAERQLCVAQGLRFHAAHLVALAKFRSNGLFR